MVIDICNTDSTYDPIGSDYWNILKKLYFAFIKVIITFATFKSFNG